MGIMTSYGSYNEVRKPIILDNCIICFCNSGMSFIAGFAVWSVVGFLQATNNLAKTKTSSAGLAFIAYPAAIDEMPGSNFWTVLLGLVLFMLGIDSAFSMVEATSTVICDTPSGKHIPRMFVAFFLCFFGFLISIPFCTNWGYILFDVIDHYLCAYLLIIVGIMQCFGVGWGFDAEMNMGKSEEHAKSIKFLTLSFWAVSVIFPLVFVIIEKTTIGIIITFGIMLVFTVLPSYFIFGKGFDLWYDDIFLCGVGRIGRSIAMLGRPNPAERQWWEGGFIFYWGFLIKYAHPIILMFILVSTCANDGDGYGGYAIGWQIAGIFVPACGLIAFVVCLFCNVYEETYDKSEFDEQHFIDTAGYDKDDKAKTSQVNQGQEPTDKQKEIELVDGGKA
jgi:SNF family Na+-dependent transporter